MAAGTFTLYDHVAAQIGNKVIDLDSDTIKLQLHTSSYTPAATHTNAASLSNEVANANGYTTGGITLTSLAFNQVSGTATFTSANAVWTASGGSITARYGVIIDTTANLLIGYYLLDATPADVTATNGNTLTAGPNVTNGWFQLQVNA